MKFSTRQDIEAPVNFVFSRLTDFDGFERQAIRRGVEVQRTAADQGKTIGAGWQLKAPFRGKQRDISAEVTKIKKPSELQIDAVSGGLEMALSAELIALSPKRTRVILGFDARPKTLSARILVQSVKFAKNTLQMRFEKRVKKFARHIEEQYSGPKPR